MKKIKKVSLVWIRADVKAFKDTISDPSLIDMIDDMWREFMEQERSMDYARMIIDRSTKMEKRQIKLQVNDVKEYEPRLWSKVKYFIPDKEYWSFITQDIRDKMKEIPLKEFIEWRWSQRFHINWCRCKLPDHKDRTASFHVYPHTNTFYCFWCHAGWSIIDFLMHNDKIDVKKAISIIKNM